jgi:predicted ATPase/DNA-binding CsgD family transcriptional regulator
VQALNEQSPLLVLDNFEQVLGAAPAMANLVSRCPGTTVLVTSRSALGINGEQRYALSPLPTPPPALTTASAIMRSDAVALFVSRARAVNPALEIDDRTAGTIAEICRKLDGLPLAIELAAARTNVLSPAALLARLSNRFQVLRSERRGVSDRLSAMRNAIAWSYDFLTPQEQELFRHMSVFPGGCSLEAVEAIFHDTGDDRVAIDVLATLIDHSLVQVVPQPTGESRYYILETLREYGLEQLEIRDGTTSAHLAYATWMQELAETAAPNLVGPQQAEWLDRVEIEWDNIRSACIWALRSEHPGIVLGIIGTIWRFCSARGHVTESRPLLDQALAATTNDESEQRSRALITAGDFAEEQRDLDVAHDFFVKGRDLAVRIGSSPEVIRAHIGLGSVAQDRGDYSSAIESQQRAATLARETGDRRSLVGAIGNMAAANYYQGNVDEAQRLWEEARQITIEIGDRQAEALLVGNLGAVASSLGEFQRAAELQERSLQLVRQLNDRPGTALALINLAEQFRHLGDFVQAETRLAEGIPMLRDLGYRGTEGQALHIHASLLLAQGDIQRAAALLLESNDRFVEVGDQHSIAENADLLAEICVACGNFDPTIELLAAASALRESLGAESPPYKVKDLAKVTQRIRQVVNPADWQRQWQTGQQLDLAALVIRITDIAHAISGAPQSSSPAPEPAQLGPLHVLTKREREVLRLLTLGHSTQDLSDTLFISPRTATTHINNIFGKLEVTSRSAAVAYALRSGIE